MELSNSVKGLVAETRKIAEKLGNDFIGLQHLLLAYNKYDDSNFKELRLTLSDRKELVSNVKGVRLTDSTNSNFPITKDLEFVLKNSSFQKWVLTDKVVEPKHLHLSILLLETKNKTEYFRILENHHISLNSLKRSIVSIQFIPILRYLGVAKLLRKIVS